MLRFSWATLLSLLVLLGPACQAPPAPQDAPSPADSAGASVPVEVYRVVPRPFRQRAAEFGTLRPSATLVLASEVTAPVLEMGFAEGDLVDSGQMLYRLDDRDFHLRLQAQEAALVEARVSLDKAEADKRRSDDLMERGVSTQRSRDDAGFALRAAQARIATLGAEIAVTKADLEKTRLVAGGTHKVVVAHARPGSLALPGQPLATLATVDPLELELRLPSHRASLLTPGQEVRVYVEGDRPGVGSRPGRVADLTFPVPPEPGFVTVRVRLPNQSGHLHPGQSARVQLTIEQRDDLIWVPAEALQRRFGAWGVYRVDAESRASFQAIERGRISGAFVEAVAGIALGDAVVVVGQERLTPGDPLEILAER